MAGHILVVDDEDGVRFSLRGILEDEGYTVSEADSGENALLFLEKNSVDLVFLDIWLPGKDGLETLKTAKELYAEIPFIMISGHGNVETAVQALRLGAHDFVEKPLSLEKILLSTRNALEMRDLKQENSLLRQAVSNDYEVPMVANSPVMRAFMRDLLKVAPTDAWVLITGENGTGKELAARTLHRNSRQKDKPFIAVNCAAIPEELIESELFGHEKGAFTGAEATKIGKFELADNGTLFLDEIGDMSLKTQAKILRILQEQCFERVGGTKNIKVQVRVIAATNKDLEKAIEEGGFRQDLYYRLRVFPLYVPPLRERKEDIAPLVKTLLQAVERKYSMKAPQLTKETVQILEEWTWPGNVRELLHLMERLTVLYSGKEVDYSMLPQEMLENVGKGQACGHMQKNGAADETLNKLLQLDYKNAKSAFEEYYLTRKLQEAGGNVSRLAERIGLERSNIHKKLKNMHE
jgi:two-component system, NtrC family, nitrogen regulation response regulator NtrX